MTLVVERLNSAMNARDIDAFVACFEEEYESEQPALVAACAMGDTEWSEWRWRGTQSDGARLEMAGVIVCGVADERLRWARLYVEPVEQSGAGIDAAVRRMSGDP